MTEKNLKNLVALCGSFMDYPEKKDGGESALPMEEYTAVLPRCDKMQELKSVAILWKIAFKEELKYIPNGKLYRVLTFNSKRYPKFKKMVYEAAKEFGR